LVPQQTQCSTTVSLLNPGDIEINADISFEMVVDEDSLVQMIALGFEMEVDKDMLAQMMVADEGTGVAVHDKQIARGVMRRLCIDQQ